MARAMAGRHMVLMALQGERQQQSPANLHRLNRPLRLAGVIL
jgi:hypothetical protein